MKQSISFVIPCFNCSDTIDATITSVVETNMEAGDEIILIDDASTDNTLHMLLGYEQRFPFVKVCRHHINKGSAAAGRNTGIDVSRNELIFCLDADNLLYPSSVAALKNFLITNNLDVVAFGRIDHFTDDPAQITETWEMVEQLNFVDALNHPMKTPCGSGNLLFTKAVWKKAGRYNESVGGAYDSELFGLKLLAEGAKFWTLPQTAYLHRKGYESTFIREYDKRNPSLLFLSALIDYWHLVHEDDVAYMFGSGRLTWVEKLEQRPLRKAGNAHPGFFQRGLRRLKRKGLSLLGA